LSNPIQFIHPFIHSDNQKQLKQQALSNLPVHIATMHFPTTTTLLLAAAAASAAALPTNQSANPNAIARRAVAGKSTFYGGNVQGGTCSFSTYKLPAGLYGTAFSGQAWDSASNCGGCVKVSHGGKSITAMVREIKSNPIQVRSVFKNQTRRDKTKGR
jgi:hypothetical protein